MLVDTISAESVEVVREHDFLRMYNIQPNSSIRVYKKIFHVNNINNNYPSWDSVFNALKLFLNNKEHISRSRISESKRIKETSKKEICYIIHN